MAASRKIEPRRGLFLDGSGNVGWALMTFTTSSMSLLRCDTFTTEPQGAGIFGRRFLFTATFLDKLIREERVDVVGFESPFMPPPIAPEKLIKMQAAGFKGFQVTQDTLRFLIGIVSVFEMVAAKYALPCSEVNVATAKKSLTGHGRAEKPAMIRACWDRDWQVKDEHQADACGVGKVVIENWQARQESEDGSSRSAVSADIRSGTGRRDPGGTGRPGRRRRPGFEVAEGQKAKIHVD